MEQAWTVSDELSQTQKVCGLIHTCHGNIQVLQLLVLAESCEHSLNLGLSQLVPAYIKCLEH